MSDAESSTPAVPLPTRALSAHATAAAPSLAARLNPRLRRLAAGGLGLFAALALWQLAAGTVLRTPDLPSASATLARLFSLASTAPFWGATRQTVITTLVGFAACLALAVPLGVLIGASDIARHGLHVVVEVFKPLPPIVILPLVVLKAGSTELTAEILVVFATVPSLAVVIAAGVRDTDPVALNTARAFGLSRLAQVRRIVAPSMLPFVVTGLRLAVISALMVTIMAELIAGAPGLGAQVNAARTADDPVSTFAYVVAIGALGVIVTAAVALAERRLLRWHPSVRGRRAAQRESLTATARLTSHLRARAATFAGTRTAIALRRLAAGLQHAAALPARAAGPLARTAAQARCTLRVADRCAPHRRSARASGARATSGICGWALELGVPVALVAGWWVWSSAANSLYFPALGSILSAFRQTWLFSHFTSDALPSLENLLSGLLVGTLAGLATGTAMAEVRRVGELLDPVVNFLRAIPGVAYVPIMILLIGFTAPMRISSIALAAAFPVLIATVDGLRSTDPMLEKVSRTYAIPRARRLAAVRLPAAAPRIAAGIEVAIAAAVMVMVASELEGTAHGIGAQTLIAQQNFELPQMWAGILLLALIGLGLSVIYGGARRRALRWYYRSRAVRQAA